MTTRRSPACTVSSDALHVPAAHRGMGQQGKLGLYNFLGFWGFGVIVGYVLCFHVGWGLKGLWSGIVAGVFLTRFDFV